MRLRGCQTALLVLGDRSRLRAVYRSGAERWGTRDGRRAIRFGISIRPVEDVPWNASLTHPARPARSARRSPDVAARVTLGTDDAAPCFMLMMPLHPDEGADHVEELSHHFDELRRMAEELGGRVRGYFVTMGEHDVVTVVRLPDDESAFDLAVLGSRARGWVRTTTARAFSLRRLIEIGKKWPPASVDAPTSCRLRVRVACSPPCPSQPRLVLHGD